MLIPERCTRFCRVNSKFITSFGVVFTKDVLTDNDNRLRGKELKTMTSFSYVGQVVLGSC